MLFKRILILTLISSVTLRESGGIALGTSTPASSAAVDGLRAVSSHNEPGLPRENKDVERDNSESSVPGLPIPSDNGDLPAMLDFELDSEAEESTYVGDGRLDFGFLERQVSPDNERLLSHSISIQAPLICLLV